MNARTTAVMLFIACSPAPKPAPASAPVLLRNYYTDAYAALLQNNFIEAYSIASKAPPQSPEAEKAKALAAELLPKIEKIMPLILQKADTALALGYAARAVTLFGDCLRMPLPTDKRREVEKRLAEAKSELAARKQELEQRLRDGRTALARGDASEAYRMFERAADIAEDQQLPWGFAEEQQLQLARANLPHQKVARAMDFRVRKRKAGPADIRASDAIIGTLDTFNVQEQEISRIKSVRDMVEKAREYKEKNMAYEAIVALEDARRRDPANLAIRQLLEGLDGERARLISEYLEVSDRYFAKQELDSAVPYLRRVLRLAPDNLRAKEAMEMYENLERIRGGGTQ